MARIGSCAIFIGEDGSMGLRNGRVYMVEVKSYPPPLYLWRIWPYVLRWVDPNTNETEWCPYSSESALHKNWKFIKREDIQYYDPERVSN